MGFKKERWIGIQMEGKSYIINCPTCGRILLKAEGVKRAELHCDKCRGVIKITMMLQGGNVLINSSEKNKVDCAKTEVQITLLV